MSGIENSLVISVRVGPFQQGHDVTRNKWPHLARHMCLQSNGQLDGSELAGLGLLEKLVQIETGHSRELFRRFKLNPGGGLKFW